MYKLILENTKRKKKSYWLQVFDDTEKKNSIAQLCLALMNANVSLLCSTWYEFVLVQVSVSLWNFIRFKNSLSLQQNVWNGVGVM